MTFGALGAGRAHWSTYGWAVAGRAGEPPRGCTLNIIALGGGTGAVTRPQKAESPERAPHSEGKAGTGSNVSFLSGDATARLSASGHSESRARVHTLTHSASRQHPEEETRAVSLHVFSLN